MSLNTAQDYLINKTAGLVDGYSETLPQTGQAVSYRALPGTTVKTLAGNRKYSTYPFVAVVRGSGNDSAALQTLCQSMVELLDLDQTGITQCNVTNEPSYAYEDDNGNLHYTFSVEVLV